MSGSWSAALVHVANRVALSSDLQLWVELLQIACGTEWKSRQMGRRTNPLELEFNPSNISNSICILWHTD